MPTASNGQLPHDTAKGAPEDADRGYVRIVELAKAYPDPRGEPVRVVDRFGLVMNRGEVVSVIGHSGCGKSTVLSMVAGLNPITFGWVFVDGEESAGAGPDKAVVFQAPALLNWMTAYQNVMLGVRSRFKDKTKAERKDMVEHYLDLVGLADSMHKRPREMSGGMQQRVGIARAIALKPKILLLDEPFGRLDSLTRMELQDVILGILAEARITTMLITHDVDEAIYMADRVCMMTVGPRARVGQMLDIPFDRPRDRTRLFDDDLFYDIRGYLVDFLDRQHRCRADIIRDNHEVSESSAPPQKPAFSPQPRDTTPEPADTIRPVRQEPADEELVGAGAPNQEGG